MSKGKVSYFNDRKGWGIIHNPESKEDIYVHFSVIMMPGYKTLKAGQDVWYDSVRMEDGLNAVNVRLAS
ncbi:MAG: cold-shock protein [Candidatus Zixiibacteriota bacterium]